MESGKDKREKTEWLTVESGIGFLAWDIDKDGKITSSKELFGCFDIDCEIKFEDGYHKLINYFDKNKDGLKINQPCLHLNAELCVMRKREVNFSTSANTRFD